VPGQSPSNASLSATRTFFAVTEPHASPAWKIGEVDFVSRIVQERDDALKVSLVRASFSGLYVQMLD
jgi:hypothetical protein